MLSKLEKEKLVIQLLEEEKSQREISKIAKVNFTFISNIRKKLEGNDSQPTTRIQAYKMYADNEEPIKVSIALEIDNLEAIKYWHEYLQLKREYKLLEIRNELGRDFLPFFSLFKDMKSNHKTVDEMRKALETAQDIEAKSSYLESLTEKISEAENTDNNLTKQIKEQRNAIANLKSEIQTLGIVKIIASKIAENLAREKKRLGFFSPYYTPRFGPQVNCYSVPVSWKPI